jgi:hypothetical protein
MWYKKQGVSLTMHNKNNCRVEEEVPALRKQIDAMQWCNVNSMLTEGSLGWGASPCPHSAGLAAVSAQHALQSCLSCQSG